MISRKIITRENKLDHWNENFLIWECGGGGGGRGVEGEGRGRGGGMHPEP